MIIVSFMLVLLVNETPKKIILSQIPENLIGSKYYKTTVFRNNVKLNITTKGSIYILASKGQSEDILNKAGFDPADIDTYMKVFNDHGDTSDVKQMNMKEKMDMIMKERIKRDTRTHKFRTHIRMPMSSYEYYAISFNLRGHHG